MNNIIYICVHDYTEMAALCVRSLRAAGKFKGSIIVFSPSWDYDDHLRSMDNSGQASVIFMKWKHHRRLDRIAALEAIFDDLSGTTGGIMGLDADVLAMGDVNPLFDFSAGDIRYQEEMWQTYGQLAPGHPTDMYLTCMSSDQRAAVAELHPINIGHYVVTGHVASRLYRAWWNLAEPLSSGHCDVHGADQAAFNAIIRTGGWVHAPWPVGDVMNASMTPEAEWSKGRLLHFAGYGNRLKKMKELSRC